ncbi:MAG TPA: nucleotidyltransferase domain-containing protein [Pyrinomonadaceae bacterium]|nr:nucleotidyltransferase domain-containing protein [Pyrinomonadaceae bacterium]
MNVDAFLEKFTCWVKEQSDIEGAALIGSYASGKATENSDVDLMILTTSPSRYLSNKQWLSVFGEVARSQNETWGAVEMVRAFYRTGLEIEYNFAAPSWAGIPIDAGTRRVVNDGMKVVFDPQHKFDALKQALLDRPGAHH